MVAKVTDVRGREGGVTRKQYKEGLCNDVIIILIALEATKICALDKIHRTVYPHYTNTKFLLLILGIEMNSWGKTNFATCEFIIVSKEKLRTLAF